MTRPRPVRSWLAAAVVLPVAVLAPACSSASTPAPAPAATAPASGAPTSAAPAEPSGSASAGPSAPPTTPTPGSVEETVAPKTQKSAKPVRLEAASSLHKGLDVRVSDVSTKKVKAERPGEVSGDSVLFTVTVKNSTGKVVDLNAMVVNVLDAGSVPAGRITTPPAKPMPNAVAGKGTARGRYVFVVPKGSRKPITVEVSLAAEDPVLVFRGPAG